MPSGPLAAPSDASKNSRRPWLWVAGLFGLGLTLFLITFTVLGPKEMISSAYFLLTEDTEFSSNYSEKKFAALTVGQSEASVVAALGKPFRDRNATPHTSWLYADAPHPEFAKNEDTPFGSYTKLTFDGDERFLRSFGTIMTSSSSSLLGGTSFITGPGHNTLGLTKEQTEDFVERGATTRELRELFGDPTEVHVSHVERWLYFSHSPGSNNYALRMVGVDGEGKVCDIRSERYWD